ncbi:hypothetical protein [Streptococcus oralis]|jgi:hypothetical protein|uniref:hypothetical protein n=1 Tax=Streptococcus oralis TaxID=1303 RepID=UPI00066EA552|nr:hypothetical protein [Streptococcus oralis]DAW49760.1 MAG TPA: hypothetical protein [Caudoviricetes sp.]
MNSTEEKIISELSFQIAQFNFEKTKTKVLYDEAIQELGFLESVLESDEELKAKFEEVKGRMTNGN